MFWDHVDRFTQSDLRSDHQQTIRARIAIAFGVMMTATALLNTVVLTGTGMGRPGMALLGLVGAGLFAATAYLGGRLRRPDISIAINLAITLVIVVLAAWGNRGGFPPAAIYLPGILLGVYLAWGRVAASIVAIPLALFFGGVVWLANTHVLPDGVGGGAAAPTLVLALATAAACGWAVFLGSTFRSATTQAYSELGKALDAAEAASRAKTQFLANMSHETRTPLNGILGLTMALRMEGGLSEKQETMLDMLTESGETLLEMLTDVLDLAQLDAAASAVESQDFVLSQIIESASARWLGTAKAKSLDWSVDLSGMSRPCLYGDAEKIRQILQYVISNAVKFTASGAIEIAVSQSQHPNSATIDTCIRVTDTGIGIAPEHQHDIFQAFQQVDGSQTRAHGGAGLGLTIASRLAKLVGGNLTLQSEPGAGTTLEINLPLQRGNAQAVAHPNPSERSISRQEPTRILVVDDARTNRLILHSYISEVFVGTEFHIDCVATGKSALNHFSRQAYDVVLIDLQNTDMDGVALMKSIRNRPRGGDTHLIAMSSETASHREQELLADGFDHLLVKPVQPGDLRSALQTINQSSVA